MNDRMKKIKLLILDVDGVMTDGRIVFDSNGVETKFFNVKDGHGIKLVQRAGIEVGIISGRKSQVVANRAAMAACVIPGPFKEGFFDCNKRNPASRAMAECKAKSSTL